MDAVDDGAAIGGKAQPVALGASSSVHATGGNHVDFVLAAKHGSNED